MRLAVAGGAAEVDFGRLAAREGKYRSVAALAEPWLIARIKPRMCLPLATKTYLTVVKTASVRRRMVR